MNVRGARVEAGKLVILTEGGECLFELDEERAALLAAGALLMRRALTCKAVREGGVLFEDQIRQAELAAPRDSTTV
jgi:hypothetical protein